MAATAPSSEAVLPSAPAIEPLPSDLDPDIAHAIDMRRGGGLRHDLEYVLASMTDPRATINLLDFPLYPEEEAKLIADQADQDVAVSVIEAYAAKHADEYGGVYIDRDEHPGFVTVLWAGHLDEHRRALTNKLDGRIVIFREVRYSHASLQALADRVLADEAWMSDIPAEMFSIGVDIIDNVVDVEVSSAEPTAAQEIADHFRLGGRLRVTSDGTGAMLIPWGTVKGRVVRPDGKRLGVNDLLLDSTSTDPGICGGGDIGYGVRENGTFEYHCQAGLRTIVVLKNVADGKWEVIGRGTVKVLAHKSVKLAIELTENP